MVKISCPKYEAKKVYFFFRGRGNVHGEPMNSHRTGFHVILLMIRRKILSPSFSFNRPARKFPVPTGWAQPDIA
jgi:hypothetical protein